MKQPQQKAVMSRAVYCILFFLLVYTSAFSQLRIGKVALKVQELQQKGVFAIEKSLFHSLPAVTDPAISKVVKKYAFVDVEGTEQLLQEKPAYIRFSLPLDNTREIKLLLYQESISPNGLNLLTDKGKPNASPDVLNYRGSIENDPSSLVAISISNDEVNGFVSNSEGNYIIGRSGNIKGRHIIYNDNALTEHSPLGCATDTDVPGNAAVNLAREATAAAVTAKCVSWYWETDYDLFVNKGSVAAVTTYMQNVFNQVATLYANDGITIALKTLYVWTTEDPYTGTSTSNLLNQFGATRTSFDGDLAHLIGTKGGGGIAYVNGACKSTKYKMAYSGISTTYQNVPVFSWTVECITHEQGHLLGSQHTHDCVWNGNNTKIDGCGDNAGYTSGSCANPGNPSGGGTIMSYCHLLSTGINFNLGFGPQPTERIINTINAASCLTACNSCAVPAQPAAITGSTNVCGAILQTYAVAAVTGATSYTWVLPSGWTGNSTTNSITVTTGPAGGTLSVTANNNCGSSTSRTLTITASAVPAVPASVAGNTAVCAGTSQTYTAAAVAGAASYTWTLPAGWTGTSTTNSITVTAGTTGGNLTVKANNTCGQSAVRTVSLTITSSAPAPPASITGNTAVCAGSSQTYTATAVAGAVSYTWTLPSGWTGSPAGNTINATAGSAGSISVVAVNGCGTSTANTLTVTVNPLPAKPGAITVSGGSATVCTGNTRTYTTPLVSGIAYNWTVPTGVSIISGQGTNSVQVSFGSSFVSGSQVSVRGVNSCGYGTATSIAVNKGILSAPGAIVGTTTSCPNYYKQYSVPAVSGATSYIWTIPAGSVISGSASGRVILVRLGSSSGYVTVKAVSACGTSAASSKYVTVTCTSGIEQNAIKQNAVVYPNPAVGTATVRFNSDANEPCAIIITDITGKTLVSVPVNAVEGINQYSFNVSKYRPGTYILTIQKRSSREVLKLNIQ